MANPKIVILCQENRSFDEYFGTFPGALGFSDPQGAAIFPQTGFAQKGGASIPVLYPFRTSTFSWSGELNGDLQHGPVNQREALASGAMNGWATAQGATALTTMGYFASNDIPYHWLLAQNFLLCDTYFCSVLGPTWPNRVFLMSGTVFGSTPPAPGTTISYQPSPVDIPVLNNMAGGWPWQSYPAMLAQSKPSITWKIYDDQNWGPPWLAWSTPSAMQVNPPSYLAFGNQPNPTIPSWPPPYGINMLAQLQDANGVFGGVGTASDPAHYSATGANDAQSAFEIDARNKNLPDISWIVPPSFLTEHPSFIPADGECYVARIVDAVMAGDWGNTILIITYDENDGHFDHVKPTTPLDPANPMAAQGGDEPWVNLGGSGANGPGPVGAGFRVPTLIISPWTVGAGVSSAIAPGAQFDHTSIIRYLEELTGVTCTNLPGAANNSWRRSNFQSLGMLFNTANPPSTSQINIVQSDVVVGWRLDALNRLFGLDPSTGSAVPATVLPTANPSPAQTWPPLQQQCYFIMDKTTFGQDEVDALRTTQGHQSGTVITGPATFVSAFFIAIDGFEPAELNLGPLVPNGSGYAPLKPVPTLTIAGTQNAPSQITVNVNNAIPDNSAMPPVPQRLLFPCDIIFNDDSAFANVTANSPLTINVKASFTSRLTWNAPEEQIELVETADPYIQNGAISYLSPELRVYEVEAGGSLFGQTLDANTPDPITFIQAVISALNSDAALGSLFETPLDTDAEEAAVSAATTYPQANGNSGPAIFNFALCRVTLQGLSDVANNVRVFFRLMPAMQTGTAFDPSTLYRSTPLQSEVAAGSNPSGAAVDTATGPNPNVPQNPTTPWYTRVPLLGIKNGAYVTFPFFATPRVTPDEAMSDQPADWPNTQLIKPQAGGAPTYAYFGCWLDINQMDGQFTASPPPGMPDGPFNNGPGTSQPISAFIRNSHQCLVAEVNYDPIPIEVGVSPGETDRLAQRNLTVAGGV